MRSIIVIPARLASTRLPRKLLLTETGRTLLQHTYEAAQQAKKPSEVVIAADHQEIAAAARAFGARVIMTSPTCPSGTDRLAEVAPQLPEADLIVNVQGDEPDLSGETIDAAIALLDKRPGIPMATLCTPIRERAKLDDPACVKVVWRPWKPGDGRSGSAIYFSRAAIPYAREWKDEYLTAEPANYYQHLGIYVYQRRYLPIYAGLPRTRLEKLENLEQLRVLEHGDTIAIGVVEEPSIGIDTPADYAAFVARWNK